MTIILRGDAQTEDARLDRVYPGVEAHLPSLRHLTAERTAGLTPRSYTWSFSAYDPHLDQGQEGACVGFGWADELACNPVPVPGVDNQYAHDKIYWEAQKVDQWPGGSYPGASPKYEGTSVLAGAQVVKNELHLIGAYDWSLTLEDLVLAVGHLGPSVLGITWRNNMFTPDYNGVIHNTGDVAGGHCILARGVSIKRKLFLLRNSWGPSWGRGGDCYISFDDVAALLAEQGEACVPQQRSK